MKCRIESFWLWAVDTESFLFLHVVVQCTNNNLHFNFNPVPDKNLDGFIRNAKLTFAGFELAAFSGSCCSALGLLR